MGPPNVLQLPAGTLWDLTGQFLVTLGGVFLGAFLANWFANRRERKQTLIDQAVIPTNARTKELLSQFQPGKLPYVTVPESYDQEWDTFQRMHKGDIPSFFHEPKDPTEAYLLNEAQDRWPELSKWERICELGQALYGPHFFALHDTFIHLLDGTGEPSDQMVQRETPGQFARRLLKSTLTLTISQREMTEEPISVESEVREVSEGWRVTLTGELVALLDDRNEAEDLRAHIAGVLKDREIEKRVETFWDVAFEIERLAEELHEETAEIIAA